MHLDPLTSQRSSSYSFVVAKGQSGAGEDGRAAGHARSDGAADARDHGAPARIRHRPPHRADQRRRPEAERGHGVRVADAASASALDFGELGRSENNRKAKFYAITAAGRRSSRGRRRTGSASRASSLASCAAEQPMTRAGRGSRLDSSHKKQGMFRPFGCGSLEPGAWSRQPTQMRSGVRRACGRTRRPWRRPAKARRAC